MKRDPEILRSILLTAEADSDWLATMSTVGRCHDDEDTLIGHLHLLEDAGLLAAYEQHGCVLGWRMTWQGHEFLDQVRDPDIWRKTKAGAAKLGSSSIRLLGELAVGFIKAKAAEMGLPLA